MKKKPFLDFLLMECSLPFGGTPWHYLRKLYFIRRNIRLSDYFIRRNVNKILLRLEGLSNYNKEYKKICTNYLADYTRIENKPVWNRAHALNIAIKKARTKYVLSTDVDVIFDKNYISEAVKSLQKNPFQVILSTFYNSPKGAISSEIDLDKNYYFLKSRSIPRDKIGPGIGGLGSGMNLTLTSFYHQLRGYDEHFILWGSEDNDLLKRFEIFGLKIKDISNKTSFIHQWHPPLEGVNTPEGIEQIKKNNAYFRNSHSVIRNRNGWGET